MGRVKGRRIRQVFDRIAIGEEERSVDFGGPLWLIGWPARQNADA